jgi:hypothetical protein
MVVVKGRIKSKVKRKPVKAGSTMPKNIGGICNAKVVATAKKRKNG